MATSVVFDGVTYFVPAFGDTGYAQGPGNMSAYWIAIATGSFQHTAGSFPLTAQANFGTSFGLTALDFISTTVNPATAGVLRLAKTDAIDWRNNANGANLPLAINGSDQLTFNGVVISTAAVGGTVNTGTAGRLTLYPATGNTVDDVYTQNAFGIDILIAAQPARSVALEYSIPNPGNAVAAATFALLQLAQTFTAAQTFATTVTISATTNQLVLGTTNTVTLTSPAPAASRTYTIPDVLGAADFVMTAGAQTIGGIKTFNAGAGAITMSASTIAMGANKITGLANGTASTDAAAFGQIPTTGYVISATTTQSSTNATATNTYADSNMTATITPSKTTSKILITASFTSRVNSSASNVEYRLLRGATDLSGANGANINYNQDVSGNDTNVSLVYLDSPATTSATTYKIQGRATAGTLNMGTADSLQSFIVMEIVA